MKQTLGHKNPFLHPIQGTYLCPAVSQCREAGRHPSTKSQHHILLTENPNPPWPLCTSQRGAVPTLLCGQGTTSPTMPSCSLAEIRTHQQQHQIILGLPRITLGLRHLDSLLVTLVQSQNKAGMLIFNGSVLIWLSL